MTARSRLVAAAALACFGAGAAAQGQFIQSPPLAQTVTTAVGAVAPGPTQVPIITWGGDIATVMANGNAKATSKTSIFGKLGLNLRLAREDVFAKQLEAYLSGRSPYLRGTLGMLNMASEAAGRDPRTKPIVIYQLTWSAGGDALVVPADGTTALKAAMGYVSGLTENREGRYGMPIDRAVIDAGAVRFRPMALTAAAVIVGAGVILFDPIFQGLAISLMAGEVASLLLSRMAVPVMYFVMNRNKEVRHAS